MLINYQSTDLQKLRDLLPQGRRTVKIKYSPYNLGCIEILNQLVSPETWIRAPAKNLEYAEGLSLAKQNVIRVLALIHAMENRKNLSLKDFLNNYRKRKSE